MKRIKIEGKVQIGKKVKAFTETVKLGKEPKRTDGFVLLTLPEGKATISLSEAQELADALPRILEEIREVAPAEEPEEEPDNA